MAKGISVIVTLFLLVACSSKYVVEGEYPAPLVPPIPIKMNLVIDQEFTDYVFSEKRVGQQDVVIEFGEAQTQLFNSLAESLFTGTDDEVQLNIIPKISRFQYAFPRESQSQVYEVWLRYNIEIEEPDGRQIASWVLTGYGKTPTALLKTRTEAVNAAAIVALRDIGAQLSIGFKRQPDIALWLASNTEETEK